jgi:NDP-sugar pyrophosphorylase family protein
MLAIKGKPFLEYQIDLLKNNGIDDIVLCIGHLGDQIESYFGDGGRLGAKIRYSHETLHLLGTGGAIRNAFDLLDDAFFVLYGDSYLDISYKDVFDCFLQKGYPALLVVYRNSNKWDKSNVVLKDDLVVLYDKNRQTTDMDYIDYGLSVLSKSLVCREIPQGVVFDLAQLYEGLSLRGLLMGYQAANRFYETGSTQGLREFEELVADRT